MDLKFNHQCIYIMRYVITTCFSIYVLLLFGIYFDHFLEYTTWTDYKSLSGQCCSHLEVKLIFIISGWFLNTSYWLHVIKTLLNTNDYYHYY